MRGWWVENREFRGMGEALGNWESYGRLGRGDRLRAGGLGRGWAESAGVGGLGKSRSRVVRLRW